MSWLFLGAIAFLVASWTLHDIRSTSNRNDINAVDSIVALQDGAVDLPELTLLGFQEASLRSFDADGSGKLSIAEFQNLLRSTRNSFAKVLLWFSAGLLSILSLSAMTFLYARSTADEDSPLQQYELLKMLGEGSYGKVYKCKKHIDACDEDYDLFYAIKFIDVSSITSANEALAEAVRLARCEHRNLIPIRDEFFVSKWAELNLFQKLFCSPYSFCVVMDLCTGGHLQGLINGWVFAKDIQRVLDEVPSTNYEHARDELEARRWDVNQTIVDLQLAEDDARGNLKRSQSVTWASPDACTELILDIFHQIAAGCAHIHKNGLVHLDLKPENVFLSPSNDSSGVLCQVGDLGLAETDIHFARKQAKLQAKKQEQQELALRRSWHRLRRQTSTIPRTPTAQSSDASLNLTPEKDEHEKWGPHLVFDQPSGTPGYIAPELWRDCDDVSDKCDTWSLGIILVDLCLGLLRVNSSAFSILLAKDETCHAIAQDDKEATDVGRAIAHWADAAENTHARTIVQRLKSLDQESGGDAVINEQLAAVISRTLNVEASQRPSCTELCIDVPASPDRKVSRW